MNRSVKWSTPDVDSITTRLAISVAAAYLSVTLFVIIKFFSTIFTLFSTTHTKTISTAVAMASTTAIANITAGTCVLPPGPLAVGPRRPGRPLPLRHECSQWHVVSAGEICAQVAAQYDTNVAGLHTLNPSLASEYKLKTGYAYCAAPCDESSPWITISTSKASNFAGSPYRKFMGTGTAAQGWPQMEDWDNYEKM